jgi:hypothetical protein
VFAGMTGTSFLHGSGCNEAIHAMAAFMCGHRFADKEHAQRKNLQPFPPHHFPKCDSIRAEMAAERGCRCEVKHAGADKLLHQWVLAIEGG